MDDVPNESGKRNHQHGFPDDIFHASGEPEDSRIHRSSTNSSDSDNEMQSTTRPANPFENGIQHLLFKDSVSSRSSSGSSVDLLRFDQTEHREEPLLQYSDTHTAKEEPADTASSSPSQGAQLANEDAFFNPRQIPPVQVMDRSEAAYDPARIPASVFTPKSNSPMDWSVASNESLFSLHVGNNSFDREQFLMMGVDFRKSRELFKSDDLQKSGELSKSGDMFKSGELFSLSPSSPIPTMEMTDSGTPKVANNSHKDANGETPYKEDQTTLPVSTSTISSHSDGSGVSGASGRSFAFPILADPKRDSTEKEEPVNIPQKQISKTSIKSISERLTSKMPSCNLCCCYCSCACLSWSPRCPSFCCHSANS